MPPGPKQKLEALLSNYGVRVEQLNDCCVDKLLEEGLDTESRLRLASQKDLEDVKLRKGDALEIYAAFHVSAAGHHRESDMILDADSRHKLDTVYQYCQKREQTATTVALSEVTTTVWTFRHTMNTSRSVLVWSQSTLLGGMMGWRAHRGTGTCHTSDASSDSKTDPCVVLDGNKFPTLLSSGALSDKLGYTIKGNPDALVVMKEAKNMPQTALRVLFELKKTDAITTTAYQIQAMTQLLLANCTAPRYKPFVVLTDLAASYTFFWIDDHQILHYSPRTAAEAWGLFDAILDHESAAALGGLVIKDESTAVPINKRQRLDLTLGRNSDVANLADLDGFLSPNELHDVRKLRLLQDFFGLPAIDSGLGHPSSAVEPPAIYL